MKSSVTDQTGLLKKLSNVWRRGGDIQFWWYRFRWNYFPSLRILNPVPIHVDIESTDVCNLRCIMCIQGIGGGVKNTGYMDRDMAIRAIDESASIGVCSIKFNFRGEPLLHKNIVEFVRRAKEKGILEVQFNTNGLPLTEKRMEELIDAGLDRIIFSVDGATKETYERIRVGGNFEKLVKNIETFIEIKNAKKRVKPFIRVQMVKYFGAEKEADQFVKYWTQRGVDNVSVIEKQDRDLKGGQPTINGKPPLGRAFCDQPWQRLNINRDGKVLMCCGDWDRKSIIGDFSKQSIKEIWRGEKMSAIRKKIARNELDDIAACKTCFRPVTYRWK